MQWPKMVKTSILMALLGLVLSVCGCTKKVETTSTAHASLKPQLELVQEISLGSVAENKIPDVTKEKWSRNLATTRPIVSPDGKYILAVGEAKMTLYDTATGKEIWEKATYGGIDNYVVSNNRLYMTEKYSYKREKEHGYIICLDIETGEELWRYDVQKVLAPVVEKYRPEGANPSICCYIKISAFGDKIFADAYSTWKVENTAGKGEVLLCLDKGGKLLWKVESHGYPGICGMSSMQVIKGKLITGSYSYGDDISGPAYVRAYDIKTGEKLWQFNIKHDDELAYAESTNVNAGVIGNKVVAVTNFGKVYILDENGNKINEFIAFSPVKHEDTIICTNVWQSDVCFGKDELILVPSKTVVKGASYYDKTPVEHPDAGSVMVFDLDGNLKWKFRLGGEATNVAAKGKYLILGTSHNQNTMDYSYCGIYAFDLSQEAKGKEIDPTEKDVLDRYIGYYHTDGAILWDSLGVSGNGKVICATTWPTRVGTEKHGKHSLYILKIK